MKCIFYQKNCFFDKTRNLKNRFYMNSKAHSIYQIHKINSQDMCYKELFCGTPDLYSLFYMQGAIHKRRQNILGGRGSQISMLQDIRRQGKFQYWGRGYQKLPKKFRHRCVLYIQRSIIGFSEDKESGVCSKSFFPFKFKSMGFEKTFSLFVINRMIRKSRIHAKCLIKHLDL